MVDEREMSLEDPEVIRQQMEDTRSSLTEKLQALEEKVTTTVQDAASSVTETVETVKESVQSSVDTVKDTFNLSLQVERHPLGMVGGSMALGFLSGWFLGRDSGFAFPAATGSPATGTERPDGNGATSFMGERIGAREPARAEGPSWIGQIMTAFAPEINKVKGMAIGALAAAVRDMLTQSAPEPLKDKLAEVINNMTAKLGGEPIREPLLREEPPRPAERPTASAHPHYRQFS